MTTTEEALDLAAIQARADAASEGPWAIWHDLDHQGFKTVGDADSYREVVEDGMTEEANPTAHVYVDEDAEFIAHAREDVPALLAALAARDATIQEALARAWYEGAAAGKDAWARGIRHPDNPYAILAQPDDEAGGE